ISTSSLSAGSHSLTAFYGGDATYQSSTSPALVQNVAGFASTTTVSSSRNPSALTLSVRFTATVSAADQGQPVPTGTVQFKIDGNNFGGPTTLANGSATSESTSVLTAGNHVVQAVY